MCTKKIFLGAAIACFLYAGMTFVYSQENPSDHESQPSWIRKDLLQRERKGLDPPRRNIFTPQQSEYGLNSPGEVPAAGRQPGSRDPADTESQAQETVYRVDIRYIGYIGSEKRTVALIIHNGEAMAVEKGELLSEQVKILDISPQSVEYVGPDSVPNKVFLEGEER
jgi:hypothetical protein